jgi:hypothetical protein
VKWMQLAAEKGNAEAQFDLGVMYETGKGVRQDYRQASEWYRKSAGQKDAQAQTNLGIFYLRGTGVKQDYAEAQKWFREGADGASPYSMKFLGTMFKNGEGVVPDMVEAFKWYFLASYWCAALPRKNCAEIDHERDSLKTTLTPEKYTQGFILAKQWKPKFEWVDGEIGN